MHTRTRIHTLSHTHTHTHTAFRPRSEEELKNAVDEVLEKSRIGDAESIAYWDVSAVTEMKYMFEHAFFFDQDLSRWDVSKVTDMWKMFAYASSFNADLSKWDVSAVTTMDEMFYDATSFDQILCGVFWVNSSATKVLMFTGSSGIISAVCAGTHAVQSD